MAQDIVTVDEEGKRTGTVPRVEAHTGDGVRHAAFTCLVFDGEGSLLLAQRSEDKRLWGGYWDGTVASHPEEGEGYGEAASRRLTEELDVGEDAFEPPTTEGCFEWRKKSPTGNGIEHEVCMVLKTILIEGEVDPEPSEIQSVSWEEYETLLSGGQPYRLCPWFECALAVLEERYTSPEDADFSEMDV